MAAIPKELNVLGLSAYQGVSGAALLRDGRAVAAGAEERFSRRAGDSGIPARAAAYCLREGGIDASDLDVVVFNGKPVADLVTELEAHLSLAPRAPVAFLRQARTWVHETLRTTRTLSKCLGGYKGPLLFSEPVESLSAAAFYPSPFARSAILVVGAGGVGATTGLGRGEGRRIEVLEEIRFPHSLGTLLAAFRESCGFAPGADDRVLLDLAPGGEARFVEAIRDRLLDLREDGSFRLDLEYFEFPSRGRATTRAFDALFGPPREPGTPVTRREMDLARSLRDVLGEALLRMARHLRERTGEENLVLAGDAAVQAAASGRLLREGPFRRVWIPPAPDQVGAALGAALCAWHGFLERDRSPGTPTGEAGVAYLGPGFPQEEVARALSRLGAQATRLGPEEISRAVARLLAEGGIVGWFQGRMELGARGLGNRSIFADPRAGNMRSRIDREVKYGEPSRFPRASVLAEAASSYFGPALDDLRGDVAVPLLAAAREGPEGASLPAVTQVDGCAFPHVVRREENPLLHDLLRAFEAQTGCAVLLETSLHLPGEPLVCTPLEAYRCFMRTGMDALAIGPFLLEKRRQESLLDDPDWPRRFSEVA